MAGEFQRVIRSAADKRILLTPHALDRMSSPSPMIGVSDVRAVVREGEIIEDYPEDRRGHSCLMLGIDRLGRPIHVVCAPKDAYLAIITAYVPDSMHWEPSWRVRKEIRP